MPRLFVGVALPTGIKRKLHKAAHEIAVPGKLLPDRNMHITLKFLGNCELETGRRGL